MGSSTLIAPNISEGRSTSKVLSDRELEVFELTGRGSSPREIAERLYLSVKTVESHRARIKDKLNLDSCNELMKHAVQWVESEDAPRASVSERGSNFRLRPE